MRTLATVVAVCLVSFHARAQTCPTRASWPTTEWPKQLVTGKEAQIKALEEYAFTLVGEDKERKGYRTDGLLIIKSGTIIYERYARGFDETGQRLRLFGQRSEDRDCLVEHPDVAGRLFQHARILSHMLRFGSHTVI